MTDKIIHKYEHVLRCPFCYSPMKAANLKSLICVKNHAFDIAKQGYVNMMTRSVRSCYDKKLFMARRKVITESNLFGRLHKKISDMIMSNIDALKEDVIIVDAGCGEGSHLRKIIDGCQNETMIGVGLDISKDGIRLAASKYKGIAWLVGDLAKSPLEDQSIHVILNIFSPANYKEFIRILNQVGFVIKVVPGPHHLIEMREALFGHTNKRSYKNDQTVSLFRHHFHLADVIDLTYTVKLTTREFMNVVQMSPLSWNASQDHFERLQGIAEVTVDVDILFGRLGNDASYERE